MGGVGSERLCEFDWEEEGMGAYSNKYDILLTIPTKRCLASYSSSAESVKNSRYVSVSAFRSP